MNYSFCEIIKEIQKDPLKPVKDLTIGKFKALQKHVVECENCTLIIEEICRKYKYFKSETESEWDRTKYN